MQVGSALGKLAHQLFPAGVVVESRGLDADTAAEETQKLMASGATSIFEATFLAGDLMARCDVLEKLDTGWRLTEVKSSTKVKDEHIEDLAFQVLVLANCGVTVTAAQVCHVNNLASKQGADIPAEQFFRIEDVSEQVFETIEEVRASVQEFLGIIEAAEPPDVKINTFCSSPVRCQFYDHCHMGQAIDDILNLPGIRRSTVVTFREQGIETIPMIPEDAKLTSDQLRARNVVRFNEPYLSDDLKFQIDRVSFPAHFIDFEAANPAIPLYEGMRPYQAFPFQWSDHVLEASDSTPLHREFLHGIPTDPRAEFVSSLLASLKNCATVVYYSSYETTTVKALAKDGIPGADELLSILEERGFDLLKVIKDHVYFADFKGSYSIKKVLPAVVPGLDYQDLSIADGDTAAIEYLRMVSTGTNDAEKAEISHNLLEYCCRDTLAMVELYKALHSLARSG